MVVAANHQADTTRLIWEYTEDTGCTGEKTGPFQRDSSSKEKKRQNTKKIYKMKYSAEELTNLIGETPE